MGFPWRGGATVLTGAALVVLGFTAWKAHTVARELVDPPFYHPQPLERVEQTYRELAAGNAADPGGTWSHREVDGLQLWTLSRSKESLGHVLLLHGFGDDRWGTSPALRWFPDLDASIFTYRRRDDVLRAGGTLPVTFGARESEEVVKVVHALEQSGVSRGRIILMGRSLGASVGLLALARLEAEEGPLGGIIWEGAPASSRDFAERLVRGPRNRWWHDPLARWIGTWASSKAARTGGYHVTDTEILTALGRATLATPSLAFIATQDRLAPSDVQQAIAARFRESKVVEVPTWHLNASHVLGPAYDQAIRAACASWLPAKNRESTGVQEPIPRR